ncbi:MAG: hypothetical protein DME33_08710 [Verrucomicrobia bacterium]|nr:MAG: hypothetical protein DME33_08710 [Verrucomicrobiota bacterium]
MSKIEQWVAIQRIDIYWEAHPRSPSAVRQPHLFKRGNRWVARLGANDSDEITGTGRTIEAALHAFDTAYLRRLHPSVCA